MRIKNWVPLIVISGLLALEIFWVRTNMDAFESVLRDSTLFFQLIVAATAIAFLRGVVGIRSFGVFGPAIIALGLSQLDPVTGLFVYFDIFLIAMGTSLALHNVGVPSGFRIAIVIAVSSITITVLELIGELYHLGMLHMSIFFPVLITSWFGDRFVMQVREIDWVEPSKRLAGTMLLIIASYFLITWDRPIEFIALNPETWGLLIGLNLAIALKVDIRLTEHLRFKEVIRRAGGASGLMTLNRRNLRYVRRYNPPNLYPHLTKDRMKATMHELGIPTPETYAIVSERSDVEKALKVMKERDSFVIKPASGFGGEGIKVVKRSRDGSFVVKGERVSLEDLKRHIVQILDGQYSSSWSDTALIEQMVISDPSIAEFHHGGVPDIRVIVFQGFPVMAMIRLPTKESGGAANLHKGAIGMGLRIQDGKGINPFWRGHGGKVETHPDTGRRLKELKLPDWKGILTIASTAQAASRLGYAGVDLVLDRSGPMVLEVNKRPGLEIQNTNLEGLLGRAVFIENRIDELRSLSVRERVMLAMRWDKEGWK